MNKMMITGLGALFAATVIAFAAAPVTATASGGLTNNAGTPVVQIAEGKKISVFRRLDKVEDGGKLITFKGPNQETVKAKVSGSRTKIYYAKKSAKVATAMKAGKTTKRSKLKTGYICKITYVAGGSNEPSELQCYFAKP